MRNLKQNHLHSSKGGILVIFAGAMFAIVTIIAVVIATGYISTNQTRVQNAINFAALGAIERFARQESDSNTTLTYLQRAEAARDYANALLNQQHLIGDTGSSSQMGQLGFVNSGAPLGTLVFGRWFPDYKIAGHTECNGTPSTPCFAPDPNQPSSGLPHVNPINAVKISLAGSSSFLAPIMGILSGATPNIAGETIASVVPRCTVMILDASRSTFQQSHLSEAQPNFNYNGYYYKGEINLSTPHSDQKCWGTSTLDNYSTPAQFYLCPRKKAYFTFDKTLLDNSGFYSIDPLDISDPDNDYCQTGSSVYTTDQGKVLCNMAYENGSLLTRGGANGTPARTNFINDYTEMPSPYGPMYADRYTDPLPLKDFLQGFNSGLQLMISQNSSTDSVGILVFKGKVYYQFPVRPTNGNPPTLSNDLNFFLEATDFQRFKATPPLYPNFYSLGWFSRADETYQANINSFTTPFGSNIIDALDESIRILSNESTCPAAAQKSVILASDGLMNCEYDSVTGWKPCFDTYPLYKKSEDYLLRNGFGDEAEPIITRMQKAHIAFTMLITGKTQPHILNKKIGEKWTTYEAARAFGLKGLATVADHDDEIYVNGSTNSQIFADVRSEDIGNSVTIHPELCPTPSSGGNSTCSATETRKAEYALANQWQPGDDGDPNTGTAFRRPVGAFMELALRTGGWFCPLLPVAPNEYIDGRFIYVPPSGTPCTSNCENLVQSDWKLSDAYRERLGENNRLLYNPYHRSPGEEAANCVQLTLGVNPFVLVKE